PPLQERIVLEFFEVCLGLGAFLGHVIRRNEADADAAAALEHLGWLMAGFQQPRNLVPHRFGYLWQVTHLPEHQADGDADLHRQESWHQRWRVEINPKS